MNQAKLLLLTKFEQVRLQAVAELSHKDERAHGVEPFVPLVCDERGRDGKTVREAEQDGVSDEEKLKTYKCRQLAADDSVAE